MEEWSIQEIARLAGVTSRTLRHYDETGLVPPTRVAANGYRYYDADALVRLQRVLLLRGLGLGIPAIAGVLAGQRDDVHALTLHLTWLREEQRRLDRQIASVETTITALRGGGRPMAAKMFEGFDHTRYEDEVEQRWGAAAYARSDAWWRGLTPEQRSAFQEQAAELILAWRDAAERGVDPAGAEGHALARRQYDWLRGIPGIPTAGGAPSKEYVVGLAGTYVTDPRFAKTYGGPEGAGFVRDAMVAFAEGDL